MRLAALASEGYSELARGSVSADAKLSTLVSNIVMVSKRSLSKLLNASIGAKPHAVSTK